MKSIARAKLKAVSQEERIHQWKQYFKNLFGKSPNVTDEPLTDIISSPLGQFTQEDINVVQRKIKDKKLQFLMKYPRNMKNKEI